MENRLELNYAVVLNDGVNTYDAGACFNNLDDALSYARMLSRESMGDGYCAVHRVGGDEMGTIYVPNGQRGRQGNCLGKNAPGMGAIPAGEGTAASPYLIASAAQLDWFSGQVNGGRNSVHGALTADITYNAGMDVEGWDGKSPNKFTPFTPMAMDPTGYKGAFDGRGHAISGIFVDRDDSPWCGLFGNIGEGGMVKDVTLRNSYFRTSHAGADSVYLGGMAGHCAGAVSGCGVCAAIIAASDLSGIDFSYIYCGGMVGYSGVAITGCAYSGNVVAGGKASSVYCGGMAGICNGAIGCTSSVSAIANGIATGSIFCGGMAGYCFGAVTDCASSGSVVAGGTATYICCGGMAGHNDDTVTGCTFSGSVDASGAATDSIYCGGAAGYARDAVTGCTSSGSVDASGTAPHIHCGGMAGDVNRADTVADCTFAGSVDISGAASSACRGRVIGHVHGDGTVKDSVG